MKSWAAVLILGLAACSGPKPGDVPSIRYGVDPCARCGMAVGEERFASGYVDGAGRSVVFDDVGEFLRAMAAEPSLEPASYVHDAVEGRWLRADGAYFVRVPGLATPMGTGYAAFASEAQARSFGAGFGAKDAPMTLTQAAASAK